MDKDRTTLIRIGLHGYGYDSMDTERTTGMQIGLHGYR